ncbi:MAG: YaiI/YqxD family protein [Clostridia bacterium]|nr:YaiI/YqxD family protein [Clostridia bacterium]
MSILVDADACPVVRQVEASAQKAGIPVTLLCDTNHVLHSDYAQVRCVSAGADAVDIALMNLCRPGDIVVTQDYGVAAMALGKRAYAIHHTGKRYTDDNIELMLMERHLARKARRASGKHHLRGPSKFTDEDRLRFKQAFEALIILATQESGGTAI